MKILISGAGIAGLSLAYWLHQSGHEPIVIEKAPNMRTEGYMIDFGGTGWDVANRMGIIPALEQDKHDIDAIIYKNGKGKSTSQVQLSKLYRAADVEGKFLVLNRRDLAQTLYEMLPQNVELRFSTTIKTINQSPDEVSVTFADGESEPFDLLIGADGIHSNVRKQVFGEETSFAHYLGYHFAVFIIPAQISLDYAFYLYLEPGVQVGIYPLKDGQWMIYTVYKSEKSVVPPREQRVKELRDVLGQGTWVVPKILEQLSAEPYIFTDTVTQIQMPRWFKNRVCLIGDAAYCPSLISGQGASMAMGGAYFLAEALHNTTNYKDAFLAYENRLRPHIQKIQKSADRFAPNFVPSSRLRISIVNWVLRLIDIPIFTKLVGKQFTVKSIL